MKSSFLNLYNRSDISKGTKFDPKYLVFGLKEESGEDTHFLGKVRKLLREALDGLLSAAEVNHLPNIPNPGRA